MAEPEARRKLPWKMIAIAVLAMVQSVILWLMGLVMPDHGGDLSLYYRTSTALLRGELPYRDFHLEYPPFSLAAFLPPHLIAFGSHLSFDSYCNLFLVENVALAAGVLLLLVRIRSLWKGGGRPGPESLVAYSWMVLIVGALLPWRYDLFPTILSVIALCAMMAKRPGWAGIWLGAAIAAKLYPIVLVPIFCIFYLVSRQFREMRRMLLGAVAVVAATFLPFLALPAHETFSFITYNIDRGLQLESASSGIIMLAQAFGLTHVGTVSNYGAVHITSPWSAAFLRFLPVLFIASAAIICWLCYRKFREEQARTGLVSTSSIIAYSLAMLMAFVVENKVFSPQYVIWLIPFFALLPLRQLALGVAICAMTILIFPFNYGGLMAMDLPMVILLNVRNLAVLALAIWLAKGLREPIASQALDEEALAGSKMS